MDKKYWINTEKRPCFSSYVFLLEKDNLLNVIFGHPVGEGGKGKIHIKVLDRKYSRSARLKRV